MICPKRLPRFFVSTVICSLLVISGSALGAEFSTESKTYVEFTVRPDPLKYEHQYIHLEGELREGDYTKFMSVLKTAFAEARSRRASVRLQLTSPGGDLIEAMKIGEMVRNLRINTVADDCSSACFFILVAGVQRFVTPFGSAYLHRPYIEPSRYSGLDHAEAETAYQSIERVVRSYLSRMDVPGYLVDEMLRIPSNEVVELSAGDFESDVGLEVPFYQERVLATCSRMSPQERTDEGVAGMYEDPKSRLGLSPGYVRYLREMRVTEHHCLQELVYRDQQGAYSTLPGSR